MIKRSIITGVVAAALIPTLSVAASSALHSDKDKLSYAMGYTTGQALKKHHIDLNVQAYTSGLQSGVVGSTPSLTPKEMGQTLQNFQKQQIKKMTQERVTQAMTNAKAGSAFLAKNKTQPGVKALANGLQYKIIKAGSGQSPKPTNKVTVNYEGKLLNGTVFDSSYKRNKPVTFPVNGVIKGWQQALTMMKPGAVWEVYIPSDLAYGATGVPGSDIGPNETLVFKINLLSVNK